LLIGQEYTPTDLVVEIICITILNYLSKISLCVYLWLRFSKKNSLSSIVLKKKLVLNAEIVYDTGLTLGIYNSIKTTLCNYNSNSESLDFVANTSKNLVSLVVSSEERELLTTLDLANIINQKTALELPVYSGKILFIKQQNTLICLVCFFQPPKGNFKATDKKKKKLKKRLRRLNASRYLRLNKLYSPLYFYKNTF
jgi:hypothetical protein